MSDCAAKTRKSWAERREFSLQFSAAILRAWNGVDFGNLDERESKCGFALLVVSPFLPATPLRLLTLSGKYPRQSASDE
jgi:hypothetical protein